MNIYLVAIKINDKSVISNPAFELCYMSIPTMNANPSNNQLRFCKHKFGMIPCHPITTIN